jgi:D-alanyl-D-alanine carboxypeptidase
MTPRLARIALLVSAAVVLAACGSGTGGTGARSSSPSTPAPLWGPPGAGALPAIYQESLQTSLDGWVERGKLAGATAAVVTPAGTWSGAAGIDGAGDALAPDSAMWIASTSKTFTAAEVLLLASRGLVDLDAPLSAYVTAPFDLATTTVRQTLAMRTGFPDYLLGPYQKTIATDLNRSWTPDEVLATMPASSPRVGRAGGTPHYNSIAYLLLAQLIEKVAKQPLAATLRRDLLDPAGLDRTWVQPTETPTAPSSVGTDPKGVTLVDPAGPFLPSRAVASFTTGGGGMAGDAADLARWGYLLYGGRVLSTPLVTEMESDPRPEPDVGPYALGTIVVTGDDGTVMVGHPGGGLDWPYTAVMEVWPGASPVAVAVLTPQPADFPSQLYDLVMNLRSAVATLPSGTTSATG